MPYEEQPSAEILVENVLVTIHEWFCEDCQVKHRLYGITVQFSDGVEAFGFCEERDTQTYINELVEAHGAVYPLEKGGS
jgi:hypothetical protein